MADPSVFSMTSTTFVTANTNDVSKVRLYNLKLIANVGIYTQAEQPFQLRITDICSYTPVTTSTPGSYLEYNVMDPAFTNTFAAWTQPTWYCGTFLYALSVVAWGPGNPSIISLTSQSSRVFKIQTNNPTDADIYDVVLVGVLTTGLSKIMNIKVQVKAPCLNATLTLNGI